MNTKSNWTSLFIFKVLRLTGIRLKSYSHCGLSYWVVLLLLLGLTTPAPAQIINTVAGSGAGGFSGDDGTATVAQLNGAAGIVVDGTGNLYIADQLNDRIRKVSPDGIITTVAGTGVGGFSGDGGVATAAQMNAPVGIVVDGAGNLYIVEWINSCIRKVDNGGIITTVAGTGAAGFSGDGGLATVAQLRFPTGVAVDDVGNLYVADRNNHCIRKVDIDGIITTVAGMGAAGFSGDGGPATLAQLNFPSGVFVDGTGSLYIADFNNHRIRKVTVASPIVDAGGPYNVNEGASVIVTASGNDPENGPLTYAWDLDNNGSFETSGQSMTFSAANLDGPSSQTIKVQVTDNGGLTATDQATVNVLNVAPIATFTNLSGTIIVGQSANLVFSNQADPSTADVTAGFKYSFDCTDDGTFEVTDATAPANSACLYPTSGIFFAKGRIKDKDGGYNDYTAQVKVQTPQQAVQSLIDQVQALNKPQVNGLIGKLRVVIDRLDNNRIDKAIEMLQEFIAQVTVFIGNGTLTVEEGQPLINAANAIIAALSNPAQAGLKKDAGDGLTAIASALPKGFQLEQNSPNPFNPMTTIQFSVPRESYVRLKVYNLFGAEVATLVDQQIVAGTYKVKWDASRLASGSYLYRLEAEGFAQTKKLLLMK